MKIVNAKKVIEIDSAIVIPEIYGTQFFTNLSEVMDRLDDERGLKNKLMLYLREILKKEDGKRDCPDDQANRNASELEHLDVLLLSLRLRLLSIELRLCCTLGWVADGGGWCRSSVSGWVAGGRGRLSGLCTRCRHWVSD
mgnify:CR=1 FL=1